MAKNRLPTTTDAPATDNGNGTAASVTTADVASGDLSPRDAMRAAIAEMREAIKGGANPVAAARVITGRNGFIDPDKSNMSLRTADGGVETFTGIRPPGPGGATDVVNKLARAGKAQACKLVYSTPSGYVGPDGKPLSDRETHIVLPRNAAVSEAVSRLADDDVIAVVDAIG